MLAQQTTPEVVSFADLRSLAEAQRPCITVSIAIPDPLQLRTRMKDATREVERHLKAAGIEGATATVLLEPIHSLASSMERAGEWSVGLALFRSPDVFRYFLLPEPSWEFVTVSERFQIRPLLPLLSREQRFYILALSQKHIRLFYCTYKGEREVQLGRLAPQSLQDWMNARIPDHVLDNRAVGGPSVGHMKGVMFGTSTDRERQDEYLTHFFIEVDKGIHQILGSEAAPLILVGVDTEIALYRRVNSYSHLMEQAVSGSPNPLTAEEIYRRALEIVTRAFSAPLRKVISEFEDYRNKNRVSLGVDRILLHACEGRVSDLLVREDAVNGDAGEDPLNLAALETVLHRGQAFALKAHEMPEKVDAAALLRF